VLDEYSGDRGLEAPVLVPANAMPDHRDIGVTLPQVQRLRAMVRAPTDRVRPP
jgi:hypothetical protein